MLQRWCGNRSLLFLTLFPHHENFEASADCEMPGRYKSSCPFSNPQTLCTFVVSIASCNVSDGRMDGILFASESAVPAIEQDKKAQAQ
jgi:hypothetical protein